jgi:hypothetical protein
VEASNRGLFQGITYHMSGGCEGIMKSLCQDRRSQDGDSNSGHPEYEPLDREVQCEQWRV